MATPKPITTATKGEVEAAMYYGTGITATKAEVEAYYGTGPTPAMHPGAIRGAVSYPQIKEVNEILSAIDKIAQDKSLSDEVVVAALQALSTMYVASRSTPT